jgi:UDP-N-acetylmuramoyl-tripeptide--D-alanyl-D-alanine ligase
VLTFGLTDDCDVRATYTTTDFGSELKVTSFPRKREPMPSAQDQQNAPQPDVSMGPRFHGGDAAEFTIKLNAAGVHNVRNALAATACALAAGIPVDAVVRGL